MNQLKKIENSLNEMEIHFSNDEILNKNSVIGYDKKFKWAWMATQLNTFIVASDFGDEPVTSATIEKQLAVAFNYAKENYSGWPRGFQSGMGVISILISSNIDESAKLYCTELQSGKKWAGFTIPVVIDSSNEMVYYFERSPMWGKIYYPYFKQLINRICLQ